MAGERDGFNSGSGIGSGFLRAHTHGQVKEIKVQRDRTMQDAASLERHNADLTAQCQALLRTVEEYREQLASPAVQRAVMISTPGQAAAAGAAAGAQDAIGKGTDAQSYITNQLVTFRNVEELQTQNEKLLKVVRQLSQDMDREAEVRKEELRAEYATRIEDALREVQEIRRERDVLEADKRSLAQQRDMYRILLAEADRSFVQPDDDSAAPPAEARASGAGVAGVAGGEGGVGGGGSSEVVSPPASRTRQTADAVRKVQSEMKELRERSEAQTSVLRAEVCMLACMVIRCRVGGCGGHGECGRQCCVLVCLCANVPMCVCVCVLCMCVHIHACVNLRAHVHTHVHAAVGDARGEDQEHAGVCAGAERQLVPQRTHGVAARDQRRPHAGSRGPAHSRQWLAGAVGRRGGEAERAHQRGQRRVASRTTFS